MLKRNPVYEALRKGKYFELNYAPMFEEVSRVTCMTNIINVFKATNAKNILLTSRADSLTTHRTPYDVAALLATLGFPKNEALAAMKENGETVVKAALHRQFFKGTIKQMPEVLVKKMGKKIKKHSEKIKQLQEGLKKEQK
jgi:RNase P/RNase MRP subunit p30